MCHFEINKGELQMSVKFDDFLKEQIQDSDFKEEFEALQSERDSIQMMIDIRIQGDSVLK